MLLHRYGRHGPEAWRIRRARRFQRSLPAIVSSRVSVQTPVSTERIIFIVIHPSDAFEENEPLPFPGEMHALQPVLDKSPIALAGEMQAIYDTEDIQALSEREGKKVTIINEHVTRRATNLAREKAREINVENIPENYEHLWKSYRDAYLAKFEERKLSIAPYLTYFPDTKAANLARKAHEDREKYTFASSGKGPFHQRDLAVVSALHELELCQDLEGFLEKIHPYADIYEEARRNPGKGVEWPEATF